MTPQWVIFWGHVTNKIDTSTFRRPIDTKGEKVLTYCQRLPSIKPHVPILKCPTWGDVTIWKIYISTFARFVASKLGRVLTSGKRFSMQTLKLCFDSFQRQVFLKDNITLKNKVAQVALFRNFLFDTVENILLLTDFT